MNNRNVIVAALITLALLAGCAAMPKFDNRLVVTPSCDKGYLVVLMGWFGVALQVDEKDTAELCKK